SPICHRIEQMSIYYRHACNHLERNLSRSDSRLSAGFPTPHASPAEPALTIGQERELLAAVSMYHIERIDAVIEDVFQSVAPRHEEDITLSFHVIDEMIHLAHRIGKKSSIEVSCIRQELVKNRTKPVQT